MIFLKAKGLNIENEIKALVQTFYNTNQVKVLNENENLEDILNSQKGQFADGLLLEVFMEKTQVEYSVKVYFFKDQKRPRTCSLKNGKYDLNGKTLSELKRQIKADVYDCLSIEKESQNPWGILMGVRPVKLVHDLMDKFQKEDVVDSILMEKYKVEEEKRHLALEIARKERPFLSAESQKAISLYICIPFCPSRCIYCSFPSNDVRKKGHLMPTYVEAIKREISDVSLSLSALGKKVDCIYVGGGTPTALPAHLLETILSSLEKNFDMSLVSEYTVEAGRPDTIDHEKLEIMKAHGVTRICVNPQTMNEKTLLRIGRAHGAKEIRHAYAMVKKMNFQTVNMDLILGLPGEDIQAVQSSLKALNEMAPENVTLHTLALKRSSLMHESQKENSIANENGSVVSMMKKAQAVLRERGLEPYYMYRQKKIKDYLENIGFSIPGHESIYNMRIMEERHTIVALGAGASSKIINGKTGRFGRWAHSKNIEVYLEKFLKEDTSFSFWRNKLQEIVK